MSFPDQEKMLKEVFVLSLVLQFLKNQLVQFAGQEKHLKNDQELKVIFLKYTPVKNLQYRHCPKI